jgi:hypothetical protein
MAEINRSNSVPSVRLFSELPEADAAEQQRQVVDDSAATMQRLRVPFEAEPADALDQLRTVPLDEDEYR